MSIPLSPRPRTLRPRAAALAAAAFGAAAFVATSGGAAAFVATSGGAAAAPPSPNPAAVKALVEAYKKDPLGPYATLRWFCPDGTTLGPQERCPTPGGLQHAVPRREVRALAEEHHVFLGQILAGTPSADFLDEEHRFSRAKQYQVERFLEAVDDGWIQKRARISFRGAYQAEDEEAWSRKFLLWLAAREDLL